MNDVAAAIVAIDEKLAAVPFDYVFIGGSVLPFLIDDSTADAVRVSHDIDIISDIHTRKDFRREERELEACGFRHGTSEGATVCRWVSDGIDMDVLPVSEEVTGWRSPWFEEALRNAVPVNINGRAVKVVSAPYFVILKLEAFEDRGKGDFICSTDFEDVICLFNGRRTIVDEIRAEAKLCRNIAGRFSRYLLNPALDDAVTGFVQTENNPDKRHAAIMSAFRCLAGSADDQSLSGTL